MDFLSGERYLLLLLFLISLLLRLPLSIFKFLLLARIHLRICYLSSFGVFEVHIWFFSPHLFLLTTNSPISCLGKSGNSKGTCISFLIFMILTLLQTWYHVYQMFFQTYVYRLEIILHSINLPLFIIEFISRFILYPNPP